MPFNLAHIGEGLSRGLEKAAHNRLEEKLRQDEIQKNVRLWKSIKLPTGESLPEETIRAISEQSPDFQKEVFKQLGLGGAGFGGNQQQANPMQSMAGLGEPQPQQQQESPQAQVPGQSMATQAAQKALQQPQVQPQQTAQPQGQVMGKIFRIGKPSGEENVERRHQENLAQETKLTGFKETAKYREKVIEDKKVARQELQDLTIMKELNSEGQLDTPGYVELLQRSGLGNIPALLSPDSEQFNKIEKGFLKNIGNYFKGSISTTEIENFMQTIPSLSNSPEGRKRVIAMLELGARAKLAYSETASEIIKANKGIPPLDLQEQVEDRVEKKIEKLAEKFREDLKKPVPKGQSKLITALQAATGSAIGLAAPVLGGAAVGAGIGAFGGPIGAGGGAAIGAGLGATKSGFGGLYRLLK